MSYKNEQKRFLTLFEQTSCAEEEKFSSDEEEQVDHVSERSENSDTEHESSTNEEEFSLENNHQIQLFYSSKDGETKWSSQSPPANARTRLENIIVSKPGIKPVARNAKTEIDCWRLFITDSMMEEIVFHTNAKIKQKQLSNKTSAHAHLLKDTSIDELLALFGLMYIAGLNHSNRQNLSDLWRTDGTGIEIFRTTMSLQRFYFLQSCLQFDDVVTRQEREKVDNIAAIRSIFEKFVSNCRSTYTPSKYLTIDEMLAAFRGKCSFRQHIPNKPAKYGIKMYALVDAKVFYTVNLEIYGGKQPDGPFSQSNTAFDVVDRLVQPVSKTNRHVTFNKWFTSIPLITHLLNNHKLTSTGALRKDTKEIPPNFISTRGRFINSSQFAFQKDMTLVSYIPKKSQVVLMLSSLHHNQSSNLTGDNSIQKPEVVSFYNSTKAGVDIVDELCALYDVSLKSKRWPMTVFYTIMNVAAINGVIVYRANNKSETNRRDFIRRLGLIMLERYLCIRKNVENLPGDLRKRIHKQMGETMSEPSAKTSKTYRRCKDCPSGKDRKTRHYCIVCNKAICMEHIISVCKNCNDLNND